MYKSVLSTLIIYSERTAFFSRYELCPKDDISCIDGCLLVEKPSLPKGETWSEAVPFAIKRSQVGV